MIAAAIAKAADAGEWAIVSRLAAHLEARRAELAGAVVLGDVRARKRAGR